MHYITKTVVLLLFTVLTLSITSGLKCPFRSKSLVHLRVHRWTANLHASLTPHEAPHHVSWCKRRRTKSAGPAGSFRIKFQASMRLSPVVLTPPISKTSSPGNTCPAGPPEARAEALEELHRGPFFFFPSGGLTLKDLLHRNGSVLQAGAYAPLQAEAQISAFLLQAHTNTLPCKSSICTKTQLRIFSPLTQQTFKTKMNLTSHLFLQPESALGRYLLQSWGYY